jgi:3-phosphoshikimate 1-carboxyvinyltransferase
MADWLALPPARSLEGDLRVPSSKSASNRALLLAALTEVPVEIRRPLESDDTRVLARCLAAMGAAIVPTESGLRVSGPLRGRGGEAVVLDAGDSGTAARFLAAAAAATPGRFRLGGSARLEERPIGELVDALRSAGARIDYEGREGCLPLSIDGGALRSGEVAVDATRSSQFVSALLLAAVVVDGGLRVRPAGPIVSEPYVAATLEVLRDFGHEAVAGETLAVRRGPRVSGFYETPGDYSSAVPLAAAVGAAGGEVMLRGLRWPSADADAAALPVLRAMGVGVEASAERVVVTSSGAAPRAVSTDASAFPDAVPALAALAMLSPEESAFSRVGHLRLKESDRIAALEAVAAAVGAVARVTEDALFVASGAGAAAVVARVRTFRDHRIAMAAAILALRRPGVLIEDPGCVAKSYPAFFRDLEHLAVR